MKTGVELIAQERQEQIEKHGRTVEKDVKENPSGELLLGAANLIHKQCYENDFPGVWDIAICRKMMAKSHKEKLIIAGALIAAEIDRLQHNL